MHVTWKAMAHQICLNRICQQLSKKMPKYIFPKEDINPVIILVMVDNVPCRRVVPEATSPVPPFYCQSNTQCTSEGC
uniref:Saposin B-type domain-containing protein n=1 Tax=Steinernema glaseri TaxID=37863 RepID=A0A1I7ZSP8_9BILA